jgi:hypothetical protein
MSVGSRWFLLNRPEMAHKISQRLSDLGIHDFEGCC